MKMAKEKRNGEMANGVMSMKMKAVGENVNNIANISIRHNNG
jgi:hypothetical protein